ncbi:cytochrome c oxidase assembly factor 6 homolog [Lampetra fluviatilis]
MTAPSGEERRRCWSGRDAFWKCADASEAAGRNPESECAALRKEFVEACPRQWTKYFDRRRDYLKFKEKLETEGFQPYQENQGGKS